MKQYKISVRTFSFQLAKGNSTYLYRVLQDYLFCKARSRFRIIHPVNSIMAGQNHNEESQKEITSNGIEPVNQDEDPNISEEYDMLDSRLDELNTALDFLEQKNDSIQDQLKELLQSNIEIRQEMQKGNTGASTNN